MKKIISFKLSGIILLILLVLLTVFHLLILSGVIPPDIVWGGQAKNPSADITAMETVAVIVTLIFIGIVLLKMGYVKLKKFTVGVKIGSWIVFGYLVFNTFTNFASAAAIETAIFAPVTAIMAFCALRVALE
jgi:hypothetical protein